MKPLRWVQNGKAIRPDGIGGEFACPHPQIAYGGPNAKRRLSRFMDSHRRTLMSRPHVTRVSRTEAGRSRELDNRGNRSGRERSSPTWGHGCRGVTGWRKSVDLVHGYEGPLLAFPLLFTVADILVVQQLVLVDLCKSPVEVGNFRLRAVDFEHRSHMWQAE